MIDLEIYGEKVDGIAFLVVEDLIAINSFLISVQTPHEEEGVLKMNELESSQARPGLVRYYQQSEDMFKLSASLIESLIKNHPFHNANKRTAIVAGSIFLLLNGYELTAPQDEVIEMTLGIATKKYDLNDLECWIAYWSRESDSRVLCLPDDYLNMFMCIQSQIK